MEHFPQTALSSLHTNPITNKLAHGLKHESDLGFSLLLLTVLNLLSLKTQLSEILAPKPKRGGMQLSPILGCSEAQGRSSAYYFSGKMKEKETGSLGFPMTAD